MTRLWGRALVVTMFWLAACSKPVERKVPVPQVVLPPPDAKAPAPAGQAVAPPIDEELQAEEPEANPQSETVKIRLNVGPPVDAVVFWGGKKLGTAGKKTLELERPRGSGPLDVVIRAAGFLPYHTRLLTDRDDKVSVRLIRPEEAPSVLGYRRPVTPPSP